MLPGNYLVKGIGLFSRKHGGPPCFLGERHWVMKGIRLFRVCTQEAWRTTMLHGNYPMKGETD